MPIAKKIQSYFQRLSNRHTLVLALIVSIVFIIVAVGLGWYNNKLIPLTTNPIARYTAEPSNPLSFMSNWDGPDYINIAKFGYQNVSQANFFPVYPILIHVINKLLFSLLNSALLISWVSLVGAIFYYIKVLKKLFKFNNNVDTLKALALFVLFPTAIFLVAAYTESLFAFFALAAIYYALERKYLLTGLLMTIGCIINLDGVFVLALVCLILLEQKVKLQKAATTLLIGLIGLAGYAYYLFVKFHHPRAFIFAQKSHGWLNHNYHELLNTVDFFNVVFLCLLVVAVVYWWRKRRSFSFYSLLFILIPVIGNQFGGFNRYVLMAFPLQFMAYDYFKDKHLSYSFLLALMGIIWAYFTMQYAGGYIGG